MKNNNEKLITIFFNMHCDVHCYSAKFEIKIQLVYGVTKKINCIVGVNELNNIVWKVNRTKL